MRTETVDGVTTIWLRQSWLSDFFMCPEKARQSLTLPRTESDATALGTALHEAIETDIKNPIEYPFDLSDLAIDTFDQLTRSAEHDGVMNWIGTRNEAIDWLGQFTFLWHRLPLRAEMIDKYERGFLRIEQPFDVPFTKGDGWVVRLEGKPDVIDVESGRVLDWKTASRGYQRWEKQRWNKQATIYTLAAWAQGEAGDAFGHGGPIPFDFVVFVKGSNPGPETISVTRDVAHWDFLARQVQASVPMFLKPDEPWTLNDEGWWCSDRWCPAFANCKGAQFGVPAEW